MPDPAIAERGPDEPRANEPGPPGVTGEPAEVEPSTVAEGGAAPTPPWGGSELGSVRWATASSSAPSDRDGGAGVDPATGPLPAVDASSPDGVSSNQAPSAATSARVPAATAANNAPRDAQMDGRLRFPDIPDNPNVIRRRWSGPRTPVHVAAAIRR